MTPNPKPEKPILLEGKNYTEFRYEIFLRANGHCESCGRWAPFRVDDNFDVFSCGHVSHITRRKRGGDVAENAKWECYDCHINKHHGPRWSEKTR